MSQGIDHSRTDVPALILLLISLLSLMSVFASKQIMSAALSVVDCLILSCTVCATSLCWSFYINLSILEVWNLEFP
jgi:hypothetical protein